MCVRAGQGSQTTRESSLVSSNCMSYGWLQAKSPVELGLPHGLLEASTWTGSHGSHGSKDLAAAFALRCCHARDLPKQAMDWCLDLCRENMKPLYERVWSWSDAKKRKQLGAVSGWHCGL